MECALWRRLVDEHDKFVIWPTGACGRCRSTMPFMSKKMNVACTRAISSCRPSAYPLALALMFLPLGAWAQAAGEAPKLQDWRDANDVVAQFKRGHIDLLKWENKNLPEEQATAQAKPGVKLMTPADAVRQAWRVHPDLVRVQSILGADVARQVAEGRLDRVDPSLQRRVDGMGELLEVAVDARKIWVEAVAARKALRFRETALISAEAGNELGGRMARVGNWSPLQAAPFQLALSTARMDLRRAQLAIAQADGAVLKLLNLVGTSATLGLPSELPDFPGEAMGRDAWAQRVDALQAQLPVMDAVRNRAATQMAFEIYSASHGLALINRDEVLKVRRFITEETVLHYNGMLKSVWNLLDEVRNQAVAEIDTIDAQRDFWLAEADLQWTLQGGTPAQFVSPGGGSAAAGGLAAH